MDRPTEKPTGFMGTYFDREAVLKVARFAGGLAWALLILYVYNTVAAIGQFWFLLASDEVSYANANIFDRMMIPTSPVIQLAPGLVYFAMLKTAQQALLILLDMEDNSRRAARK